MRSLFATIFMLFPLTILIASSMPVSVATTRLVVFQHTATSTYTSTVLFTTLTSTAGYTMVQKPLNIAPEGVGFITAKGKCGQDTIPLTVKSGAKLSLQLTSGNPANLYLLPSPTYQTSSNGCNLIGNSLLAANNFTDYTLHWTAAQNGTIYLLLTGPNTIIIMRDLGSTESIQQFATSTYARTETELELQSAANLENYTTTTVASHTSTLLPQIPVELSFIGFTLSLLAMALLSWPGARFLRARAPKMDKKT